MAEDPKPTEDDGKDVGAAPGGGDASGSGNILAGVQDDEDGEERRKDD